VQSDTIKVIVEWLWMPIVGGLITLWVKISGLDTRAQLLERSEIHFIKLRDEDRSRRDQERKEIIEHVERHHQMVMTKLDSLETRIKNGH
jgi:hypothetical protein